ncbi:MAG: hypothetical protein KGN02_14750 [bacterium]|nr:hypothetical protein [bacterium]
MTNVDRQRAAQFCDNARYFLALGTERALQSALYFFDQALAVDRESATAYAGKARCYAEIGDGGYMPSPLPQLRLLDFANRSLAIERLPEARVLRAKALAELRYAFAAASAELDDLDDAEARSTRALIAIYAGRFDDALALANDPLVRAVALLYARRPREASAMLELADPHGARLWNVPTLFGLARYLDGDLDGALDHWERVRRTHPTANAYLLHAYGAAQRHDEFAALKSALDDDPSIGYRSPFWEAIAYAGIGRTDEAHEALARGIALRDPWMPRLLVEPMLDPLRDTPAFERLAAIVRDGTELPARPGT